MNIYEQLTIIINLLLFVCAVILGWQIGGKVNQNNMKHQIKMAQLFEGCEEGKAPYYALKQKAFDLGLSALEFENLRISALRQGIITQLKGQEGFMYALDPLFVETI